MAFQTVFKRYEIKFLITAEQKNRITEAVKPYVKPDEYGRCVIRSVYFDTDNYRLARRSAEKPAYKEKLRVRSYQKAEPDSTVFAELKKKYQSVVYKRRVALQARDAMAWLSGEKNCPFRNQITDEIDYFVGYYETLRPAAFLSCEREAFNSPDSSHLRITFDRQLLCRTYDLSPEYGVYGEALLPPETELMEIKCAGGIPLWLTKILSAEHIYKTSFSKYGTAYAALILPKLTKETALYV